MRATTTRPAEFKNAPEHSNTMPYIGKITKTTKPSEQPQDLDYQAWTDLVSARGDFRMDPWQSFDEETGAPIMESPSPMQVKWIVNEEPIGIFAFNTE